MSSISLSQEELIELTGLKRPSAQINWLRRNGFIVLKRADGQPVVLRQHIEEMMMNRKPREKRDIEPDWKQITDA